MTNASFLFGLVLAATLVSGCVRDYPKIVFLSEKPLAQIDPTVTPSKPVLSAEELRQIEQLLFERLMDGHFGDDGHYSAIFLQADEAQTTAMMKKFAKHQPPIKQLWHSNIRAGFAPLDKDTGKPAMIFSCEIGEPENGAVTALARWYAGEAVKGYYPVTFRQTSNGWVVNEN